ncbi:transmembrane protein 69-like isoform X1 [Panulirus ornatus]|uniref:transmembrane protein 69-like isoform X1 n=1 Tax=Panulirus ornatus TaxID=150431 RepID=UPI003A8A85AB
MMTSLWWLGRCRSPFCNMVVGSLDSAWTQRQLVRITDGVAQHFHTSQCYKFKEDKKTTAIAILDNVKQVRHSPTPALALGFSGLIPFVAAPVYMVTSGVFEPDVAQAQLFYGASILSFLGGVRWGLTLPESSSQPPDWHNLGYSVTPSLIAWIGLIAPHSVGMLTVIAGLGLTGYMDLAMWGYPTWFKGMRFCLTFIAILSLWTSFVFKFILNDSKVDKELDVKSESQ